MKKFKEFFVNSFFFYLAIELVEEVLEDLISLGISSLLIKGFSTLFVVSLTQGVKLLIKRIVKQITYKEGNDKMSKIKSFFTLIWANKKSIIGTIGGLISGVSTAIATNSDAILELPKLLVFGFNLTPVIAGVLVFVGVEMGIVGKGFETIKHFFDRKAKEKAEKEQKALVKEAEKELANEEKVANQTQAEQAKAQAKAEAEAKAKAEKEKADAEHKAKVEAIKAEIKANKS